MKIARVLPKTLLLEAQSDAADLASASGRPRVALERDGAFYDLETLERTFERDGDDPLGPRVNELDAPSDFHTRVATLRCAGLYEADMKLLQGRRPSPARIHLDEAMLLAPCDTERAALVSVDTRRLVDGGGPVARLGQARALGGQDALVAVSEGERFRVEVSLATIIGDDLSRASRRDAASAIMGYAILVDWIAESSTGALDELALARGRSATLGPALTGRYAFAKPNMAEAFVTVGGEQRTIGAFGALGLTVEEAVSFASGELELRAGDVVAVGPFAPDSPVFVPLHCDVAVEIAGLGELRGRAVPRRPHTAWRK